MNKDQYKSRFLFIILGSIFLTNAILAEFIGVKIFSLESTLGIAAFDFSLFGRDHLSFNMTAGVLLWPVVFVLTDVINEYYGMRGVKLLSWIAAGMIAYAFIMVWLSIGLSPADFWVGSRQAYGVENMQAAFSSIFGQGLWIIIGSLIAFLVGQFVDVFVFHRIRKLTGERMIWLRATGSTLVSQFIDSFLVLFVAFYIGAGWDLGLVMAIGVVNYTYKFIVAVLMTPILYGVHAMINRYLGLPLARSMMQSAEASERIS
jgi:queuosine precursor transporter